MQLQETGTELTPVCPVKVNVPFLHGRPSMETEVALPAETVPVAGVKVTPLPRSLLTDQLTVPPWALRVTLQ